MSMKTQEIRWNKKIDRLGIEVRPGLWKIFSHSFKFKGADWGKVQQSRIYLVF